MSTDLSAQFLAILKEDLKKQVLAEVCDAVMVSRIEKMERKLTEVRFDVRGILPQLRALGASVTTSARMSSYLLNKFEKVSADMKEVAEARKEQDSFPKDLDARLVSVTGALSEATAVLEKKEKEDEKSKELVRSLCALIAQGK